jgi:hypothetical protein
LLPDSIRGELDVRVVDGIIDKFSRKPIIKPQPEIQDHTVNRDVVLGVQITRRGTNIVDIVVQPQRLNPRVGDVDHLQMLEMGLDPRFEFIPLGEIISEVKLHAVIVNKMIPPFERPASVIETVPRNNAHGVFP